MRQRPFYSPGSSTPTITDPLHLEEVAKQADAQWFCQSKAHSGKRNQQSVSQSNFSTAGFWRKCAESGASQFLHATSIVRPVHLTPTLSPEEREHCRQRLGEVTLQYFRRLPTAPPLLGERVGVRGKSANDKNRRSKIEMCAQSSVWVKSEG